MKTAKNALLMFLYASLAWALPCTIQASQTTHREQYTTVSNVALLFPSQVVRPGTELKGVVEFYIENDWHLYWKNPGGTGLAPSFDWQLPPGLVIKDIQWPTPSILFSGGTPFYGYSKNPQLVVTFTIDESMPEGTYPIVLSAFWLACDGSCVPGSQQFETSLTISASAPKTVDNALLHDAQKNIPIPLSGGEASSHNDRLLLQLPVPEEALSHIESVILYPEQAGLFTLDQTPIWSTTNDKLTLSIPSLSQADSILEKSKHFSGLCQIISKNKPPVTFSFTAIYSPAIQNDLLPIFDQSWERQNTIDTLTDASAQTTLNTALLFALLGGFILNFTPCVLPIVGLKLLTLISFREPRRWKTLPHGIVYALGILATFWALAGMLYAFEYFGITMGWGFQLQNPLFVLALIIIFFCLALNLFGLFEIGTSLASWASLIDQNKGVFSNPQVPTFSATFISGVLATLIASPCTGPFLGSVLGFAAVFHPKDGLLLFTAMGLGMSLPIIFVTAFPALLYLLPRPGAWMISMKQFFGFCVLATVTWLLWVLDAQVPSLSLPWIISGLTTVAFGLWIYGTWGTPVKPLITRLIGRALAVLFVACGVALLASDVDARVIPWAKSFFPKSTTISWEPFSKNRLESELKKKNIVFVSFSAKWCLTCQTNALAFLSPKVVKAFEDHHIVALNADWTLEDPAITEMLRSLGRNGVPVYAMFTKDQKPLLLPEIVTPDLIVEDVELVSRGARASS